MTKSTWLIFYLTYSLSGVLWLFHGRPRCPAVFKRTLQELNPVEIKHVLCYIPLGSLTCNYDFPSRVFRSTQVRSDKYDSETRTFSSTPSFRFLKKMADSTIVNNCLMAQNKQLYHEYKMIDRVLLVNMCFYIQLLVWWSNSSTVTRCHS